MQSVTVDENVFLEHIETLYAKDVRVETGLVIGIKVCRVL
jgi:hypothetical protein